MSLHADTPRVAMQLSQGVVVASIQVDLDEEVLIRFQEDLLGRVHESGSRAVILDVSGLETLDSEEFAAMRRIIAMVDLLGAESVMAGLQPGVVSSLIEAGADIDGVRAAIDLDAAFDLLRPKPEQADGARPEAGGAEEKAAEWDAEREVALLPATGAAEDER